jgi:hypothetical protein
MMSRTYLAIERWLARQEAPALPVPSAAATTMSVRFSMGDVEFVVSGPVDAQNAITDSVQRLMLDPDLSGDTCTRHPNA